MADPLTLPPDLVDTTDAQIEVPSDAQDTTAHIALPPDLFDTTQINPASGMTDIEEQEFMPIEASGTINYKPPSFTDVVGQNLESQAAQPPGPISRAIRKEFRAIGQGIEWAQDNIGVPMLDSILGVAGFDPETPMPGGKVLPPAGRVIAAAATSAITGSKKLATETAGYMQQEVLPNAPHDQLLQMMQESSEYQTFSETSKAASSAALTAPLIPSLIVKGANAGARLGHAWYQGSKYAPHVGKALGAATVGATESVGYQALHNLLSSEETPILEGSLTALGVGAIMGAAPIAGIDLGRKIVGKIDKMIHGTPLPTMNRVPMEMPGFRPGVAILHTDNNKNMSVVFREINLHGDPEKWSSMPIRMGENGKPEISSLLDIGDRANELGISISAGSKGRIDYYRKQLGDRPTELLLGHELDPQQLAAGKYVPGRMAIPVTNPVTGYTRIVNVYPSTKIPKGAKVGRQFVPPSRRMRGNVSAGEPAMPGDYVYINADSNYQLRGETVGEREGLAATYVGLANTPGYVYVDIPTENLAKLKQSKPLSIAEKAKLQTGVPGRMPHQGIVGPTYTTPATYRGYKTGNTPLEFDVPEGTIGSVTVQHPEFDPASDKALTEALSKNITVTRVAVPASSVFQVPVLPEHAWPLLPPNIPLPARTPEGMVLLDTAVAEINKDMPLMGKLASFATGKKEKELTNFLGGWLSPEYRGPIPLRSIMMNLNGSRNLERAAAPILKRIARALPPSPTGKDKGNPFGYYGKQLIRIVEDMGSAAEIAKYGPNAEAIQNARFEDFMKNMTPLYKARLNDDVRPIIDQLKADSDWILEHGHSRNMTMLSDIVGGNSPLVTKLGDMQITTPGIESLVAARNAAATQQYVTRVAMLHMLSGAPPGIIVKGKSLKQLFIEKSADRIQTYAQQITEADPTLNVGQVRTQIENVLLSEDPWDKLHKLGKAGPGSAGQGLKARNNKITDAVRDLLGQNDTGALRLAVASARAASLRARYEALEQIVDIREGTVDPLTGQVLPINPYFSPGPDAAGRLVKLDNDRTTFGPLAGKYVTPQLKTYLEWLPTPDVVSSVHPLLNLLDTSVRLFKGAITVAGTKQVWVANIMRNVLIGNTLAGGIHPLHPQDLPKLWDAFTMLAEYGWKGGTYNGRTKTVLEAIKFGVLTDGFARAEILGKDKKLYELWEKAFEGSSTQVDVMNKLKATVEAGLMPAKIYFKIYDLSDQLAKLSNWIALRNRYLSPRHAPYLGMPLGNSKGLAPDELLTYKGGGPEADALIRRASQLAAYEVNQSFSAFSRVAPYLDKARSGIGAFAFDPMITSKMEEMRVWAATAERVAKGDSQLLARMLGTAGLFGAVAAGTREWRRYNAISDEEIEAQHKLTGSTTQAFRPGMFFGANRNDDGSVTAYDMTAYFELLRLLQGNKKVPAWSRIATNAAEMPFNPHVANQLERVREAFGSERVNPSPYDAVPRPGENRLAFILKNHVFKSGGGLVPGEITGPLSAATKTGAFAGESIAGAPLPAGNNQFDIALTPIQAGLKALGMPIVGNYNLDNSMNFLLEKRRNILTMIKSLRVAGIEYANSGHPEALQAEVVTTLNKATRELNEISDLTDKIKAAKLANEKLKKGK